MNPESKSSQTAKAHGEHVILLAKQLADGNRPGVLATVDHEGRPHMRWMATLSLQEFPCLYALTSPVSRKVTHIRTNPNVTWMFTTEGSSMVLHLSGTAKIVTEKSVVNRVWRLIEIKSNAVFLSLNTTSDGIAVIETLIDDIEYVVPRYDLHYPSKPADYSIPSPDTASPQKE